METALISLICVAIIVVGTVTTVMTSFNAASSVSESLKEMEEQAAGIRLTEIDASQWQPNVYAIAYQGNDDDGYLKTVNVATDGMITNTVIDTLEFDAVNGVKPGIIQVSSNVYAVAYQGENDHGYLKTAEIATDGMITDTVIDTLEFDTVQGQEPDIIHVSGDIYAIAYRGENDDDYLATVEIAADGQITNTVIDTLEFDNNDGWEPDIIHVSGDVYAAACRGNDDDGWLQTIEIAADGEITNTVIDTLEFDNSGGYEPDIIHVSGDVYAIAYRRSNDDAYLKTVEIATDGQITNTVIDTLEFDNDWGHQPVLIHVSGDVYAIVYQDENNDGYLKTVEIATDGQITDSVLDTLEFDNDDGREPDIIHVSGDVYAIGYRGDDADGFLKTVEIATNGQITNTAIDTLEFDTSRTEYPKVTVSPHGIRHFYIKILNQGQVSLSQFNKWDIIVQYEDGTTTYIDHTTDAYPGSNEWTVEGIYLLDDSAEVFEPDILNPGEQMRLYLSINPGIGRDENVRITISTANGVKAECLISD